MATTVYDIGDQITLLFTFRNGDGDLATPSTREARYIRPGDPTTGTEVTPVVESTGVLAVGLPVFDTPGIWYVRCAGTAGVVAAAETYVRVVASAFTEEES